MASDAAYQTLRRLLAAPPANRAHVDLLDRHALYGAVGHYLAVMSLLNVSEFASVLVASPALWAPQPGAPHTRAAVERATGMTQALSFALSERVTVITKAIGKTAPRSAPSELGAWLQALLHGVHTHTDDAPHTRLARLALITGLVQGLANEKRHRTHFSLWFHLRRHAHTLETAWSTALARALELEHVPTRTATLTLAASVVDMVPDHCMRTVSDKAWIEAALPLVLGVFDVSSQLFGDAMRDDRGVVSLPASGPTCAWQQRVSTHALYTHAGPLARLVAAALRRLGASLSPADYMDALWGTHGIFRPWLDASAALDTAWTSSCLAGVDAKHLPSETRERTTGVWHIFKTYLFTLTVVFDAVVHVVVEQCPSPSEAYPAANERHGAWPAMPTSNVPAPYLAILTQILRVFERVYFITSTFGLDGFESYRVVLYSALDVLSRDAEACTQLVSAMAHDLLERHGVSAPDAQPAAHVRMGQRMHVTYLLLVVEQWVSELPDTMINQLILPLCRPYLQDTRFQDTFESAHSVVLALYTCGAACTRELTPFYVDMLLHTCVPRKQLSASQLQVACTTIVESLSHHSDSLAWWCIEQLDDQISVMQLQGRDDDAMSLALCLAAILPHVNLVLLRSLLTRISARILERPAPSAERTQLVERVHESLRDMDASTRLEAMQWWLSHSDTFTQGMS